MACMQEGQKSLLQTTSDARSSGKYLLSLASNLDGLRMTLLCSSGNSCQILGKLYRGNKSKVDNMCWAKLVEIT